MLGVLEPDCNQDEIRLEYELAPGHGREVARGGPGHLPGIHVADVSVLATEAGDLGPPAALATLLERVRGWRALGRKRPRMAGVVPVRGKIRIHIEHRDNFVAGLASDERGYSFGSHATGGRHCRFRAFQCSDFLLCGCHGRVPIT